jgi:predicted transcriptional regulator
MELKEIERRINAGHTVTAVAAAAGVTDRTIRNRLHRAGRPLARDRAVVRWQQAADRERRLLDSADWLTQQYVDRRRSASQIARDTHTTTAEVHAALTRQGVTRPPARPELTPDALRAAFAAGETVSSIARRAGVDRSGVRERMRRAGIRNPHFTPTTRPAVLDDAAWLSEQSASPKATVRQIAADLGVSDTTVRRALRRSGVEWRRGAKPPGGVDADWLHDLYTIRLLPVADIAEQANVSQNTIRRALVFHQVPRRPMEIRRPRRASSRPPAPRAPHPHADRPGGIDPAWLRTEYLRRRRTLREIADELGIGVTTVQRAVHAHGLRRLPRRRHPKALADERWLRIRYLREGATAGDIADELGVSVAAVRAALRGADIRRSSR